MSVFLLLIFRWSLYYRSQRQNDAKSSIKVRYSCKIHQLEVLDGSNVTTKYKYVSILEVEGTQNYEHTFNCFRSVRITAKRDETLIC